MVKSILAIEASVSDLQKSNVTLQEQLKTNHNNFERNFNAVALKIIDILDLIDTVRSNMVEGETNYKLIINKIEKRLIAILDFLRVEEITFNQLEQGKTRVIDTRKSSADVGTIIEVCRKGYQRNGKAIRLADVITAGDIKPN